MIADVASDHQAMWWITLGLGVVVISATILLLQLLVVFVKDIDTSAREASEEAGGIASNTAATSTLNDTVSLAGDLRDETGRHARALTAVAGGTA